MDVAVAEGGIVLEDKRRKRKKGKGCDKGCRREDSNGRIHAGDPTGHQLFENDDM